jgi:hypothetical protein
MYRKLPYEVIHIIFEFCRYKTVISVFKDLKCDWYPYTLEYYKKICCKLRSRKFLYDYKTKINIENSLIYDEIYEYKSFMSRYIGYYKSISDNLFEKIGVTDYYEFQDKFDYENEIEHIGTQLALVNNMFSGWYTYKTVDIRTQLDKLSEIYIKIRNKYNEFNVIRFDLYEGRITHELEEMERDKDTKVTLVTDGIDYKINIKVSNYAGLRLRFHLIRMYFGDLDIKKIILEPIKYIRPSNFSIYSACLLIGVKLIKKYFKKVNNYTLITKMDMINNEKVSGSILDEYHRLKGYQIIHSWKVFNMKYFRTSDHNTMWIVNNDGKRILLLGDKIPL